MASKFFGIGRLAVMAAAALLALAAPALGDKIVLKDGRTFEGSVIREENGYVWFKAGGAELFFKPDEVKTLERDSNPAPAETAAVATPARPAAEADGRRSGTPRAAIITIGDHAVGDMVGMYVTAKTLKDSIPLLEADNVDVVVFRVDSQGGYLIEIQRVSDVIQNEFKPRFRTVAWIESAISAAAMSTLCIEEIYFTPEGNFGACTGWSGALVAVKDRDLEEVLYMMEKISARGGYDPKIMRSMQIMEPLSATIDETGEVHWTQDTSGQFIVNPENRILTFNAVDAEKFKFSKGTARTIDELTTLMGFQELDWVGQKKKGFSWPISRAEQVQLDYRSQVNEDEKRTREYFARYGMSVQLAQGTPKEDRGAFVGKAREALRLIERMVKNNPNFAIFIFNIFPVEDFKYWIQDREKELRDLMR